MNSANQFSAIEDLIPHRPPMRLLDKIVSADATRLTAMANLSNGCPFWTPQGVPTCIGLEYIGQAAAAFFSVIASGKSAEEAPRAGMLIASRAYQCNTGFFPAECRLLIEVIPQSEVSASGLVKFSGTLTDFATSESFAKGDISVYLPPA